MLSRFLYGRAFARNLGWVHEWEQLALRGKRVAIAGMGGVGGVHLTTLARLGVGSFSIADFDRFDLVNFNRQAGANISTIGRPKVEVMEEMALAINPELRIRRFDEGLTPENVDDFLDGADLFVDGLDFFVLDIRRRVFARCRDRGIPAITAAPIGMGTGLLVFHPGGMSFEQYFRLEGRPQAEQYLRFLMGVAPRGLHRAYLVDPRRVDLAARRGPSTAAACQLCAGVVATEAVKLLLGRSGVYAAPWHRHFDAYRNRLAVSWLPFGNGGPLQSLKLALGRRTLAAVANRASAPEPFQPRTPLEEIVNLARWSPSGDNVQPWRFEVTGEDSLLVRLTGQPPTNPYEIRDGEPTLLAGGMLLETMRIAASNWGRALHWRLTRESAPWQIQVQLPPEHGTTRDSLFSAITQRSVDRRSHRMRPLTTTERSALEAAVAGVLRLAWYTSLGARWRIARLGTQATDIRLRAPETFRIHQSIIDWSPGDSSTGIPARAVGLAPSTLWSMRWAMRDWARMRWMNRAGGTLMAAGQMDLLPGLRCAAFFAMRPDGAPQWEPVEHRLRMGQAVQRFWLTATDLGLSVQPTYATLAFAHYGARAIRFSGEPRLEAKSATLAREFRSVFGDDPDAFAFLGRIGERIPRLPGPRSIRRPLPELMPGGILEEPDAGGK